MWSDFRKPKDESEARNGKKQVWIKIFHKILANAEVGRRPSFVFGNTIKKQPYKQHCNKNKLAGYNIKVKQQCGYDIQIKYLQPDNFLLFSFFYIHNESIL